jgi:4-amino-4-deoxy-L-arabinose transferase-like glycosyltransferase
MGRGLGKVIPRFSKTNLWVRLDEGKAKMWKLLTLILAIAFGLRCFLLLYPEVIHSDGVEYIHHAKEILAGNWMGGTSGPVYPALISFAHLFVKNYEIAGIWVSVILGSLLVLPVFYLGKAIFNKKVGILSALLAAVHPFLYIYSGAVLTESTYYFLLTTSVLFGWQAFKGGKLWSIFLFSFFSTLAFLTKPESIGLIFILCVWMFFFNPPEAKRSWIKRVTMILITILALLFFSSPYLIAIRKETGKWSISKKLNVSIGFTSEEKDETVPHQGKIWRHGLNLVSLIKHPLPLLAIAVPGFLDSLYKFQQSFNPTLLVLALLGWIRIIRRRPLYSLKANFYVISHHLFFFGLILPIFWVGRRYSSQMIPISIPWAAFGFWVALDWVYQRWKFVMEKERGVTTLLIILLMVVLFSQGRIVYTREHRVIQKEAGLWMKNHLPRGIKVMSRLPQEAFYAELAWVIFPRKSYEEVLKAARFNGVQYLIINEHIEEDSPGFLGKMEEKDLILLKDLKRKNQRMAIFKVVY